VPTAWAGRASQLALEARRARQLFLSADVRRLRALSRLTQSAFADAIGVDRATVVQWEAGTRVPAGRRIEALLEFERGLRAALPNPLLRDCSRCEKSYPRTDRYFHRNDAAPDGLHSICRGCRTGAGEEYWLRRYGTIL
jgi:transcriptional regulator with XRE-family HTH domain